MQPKYKDKGLWYGETFDVYRWLMEKHGIDRAVIVGSHVRKTTAQIEALLDKARLEPRAGGEAFVAGVFFSESFAQTICERFRKRRFFATVERREKEADAVESGD